MRNSHSSKRCKTHVFFFPESRLESLEEDLAVLKLTVSHLACRAARLAEGLDIAFEKMQFEDTFDLYWVNGVRKRSS